MPQVVSCPQCNRQLKVPDALLGKAVKCPGCGATFTASGGAGASPAPVAPPPEQYGLAGPAARPPPAPDDYEEESPYEGRPRRRRRSAYTKPHRGGMILTFGIIGFVCGPLALVFGPMAWVMGGNDLREIREGRMDPEGEGLTRAGQICGMIVTILVVAGLALYCVIFIVMAAAGGFK